MKIECYNSFEPLTPYLKEWERIGAQNPFMSPQWLLSAERAYKPDGLCITVALEGEKLIGLLPVVSRKGGKIYEGMAEQYGDYGGLLVSDEVDDKDVVAEELIRGIFKHTGTARLRLRRLHVEHTSSGAVISILKQRKFDYELMRTSHTFHLPLVGSFEESMKSLRSSKSRYNLRRSLRQLSESGDVQFELCDNIESRSACISQLAILHKQRWPGGLYSTEAGVAFISKVVDAFADRAQLLRLKLDDKVIAIQLSVVFGEAYHYYNVVYDDAYSKYSPGSLLLQKGIEIACSHGCTKFDLLMGPEPYKREWGANSISLETVTVYNAHSLVGRIMGYFSRLQNKHFSD